MACCHAIWLFAVVVQSDDVPGNGDHVVRPPYNIDPDLLDQGNPKGQLFNFDLTIADSKIFNGSDPALGPPPKIINKYRQISVYVPAKYQDGDAAPIMVMQDGPGLLYLVSNMMDNLVESGNPNRTLPAFIAIAVQNGGLPVDPFLMLRHDERQLEYDSMSDRYARYVTEEVLPAVLNRYEIRAAYPKLRFTDDPWGRAASGCSSGASASVTMGWFRPDLFRRIVAYSASLTNIMYNIPERALFPMGAWEYHSDMELIRNSPKKPLRVFHHSSDNDLGTPHGCYDGIPIRPNFRNNTGVNWAVANNRTAEALRDKGYAYRHLYSLEACHCDPRVIKATLADTFVWIWQDYSPKPTSGVSTVFV
jgi:hypothetical protein